MHEKKAVRGVSLFREFKTSNIIKVELSNGEQLKGVYYGQVIYEATTYVRNQVKKGQFMVVYDIMNRVAQMVDVLGYCKGKDVYIKGVSATRLPKTLSDYLRGYYKIYVKYQDTQKQTLEFMHKKTRQEEELRGFGSQGLDDNTHQTMAKELSKQDPKKYIQTILNESVSGGNLSYSTHNDDYSFLYYYDGVQGNSYDVGATTYLEYDDTRMIDTLPQPSKIEALIRRSYPRVTSQYYLDFVNKYKKYIDFSKDCFDAELRSDKGDRFTVYFTFTAKFKQPSKVKAELLDRFVKDLNQLVSRMVPN